MSAEEPKRRQLPPAEEMDLFYRTPPLAPPLDSPDDEDDQDQQELELGLSLGGHPRCKGGRRDDDGRGAAKAWGDRCRILTAGDFPAPGHLAVRVAANPSSPSASTSSVSSSSSSLAASGRPGAAVAGGGGVGTKRHAEPAAPEARSNPPGQVVVGWPPIRTFRVNNLVNHPPKDNTAKESPSARYSNTLGQGSDSHLGCSSNSASAQENAVAGANEHEKKKTSSRLVKVNMDGMAIGRKVDLTAQSSYNALALALEDMFQTRNPYLTKNTSKLLDGSSEFVLTYEDRDGDWMLVGDVPWGMFLNSVRRLRIMRTCDANVLAPGVGVQSNTNGLRSIHR